MKKVTFIFLMGMISSNAMADGGTVYDQICSTCHDQGVFGAPKMGIASDWTARISKGIGVLNNNAIEGYAGSQGFMPPRGGDPELSDEEVKSAVRYMVDQSW